MPVIAALSSWQQGLLQWLGYDFSRSPERADVELIWTNLPTSWGVFVLIAALAGVLYGVVSLYRRELASCPPWAKFVLAALRAGALLLLAVIFLGPALVYLQYRTVQPAIVLARDASQSMNTADRYDDEAARGLAAALRKTDSELAAERPTRAAIVDALLARDRGALPAAIAQRGKLTLFNFAEQATKVEPQRDSAGSSADSAQALAPTISLPPLVADGRGTDLAGAIRQALAADSPAAIVLFTDGQHTGQDDPRAAAREAGARGVPLLVVGIGDPSRPKNLRVASLYVRPQVWQDEPFEIDAVLNAEGVDASEVRLELIEQRVSETGQPAGGGAVVQSLQVPVPAGGGRLRAEFSHTAKEAARFIYSVRAEPVAGELDEADNQLGSAVVKVLSRERVRVLLVAGAPTWEYRLLQKLLARDRTLTLSCWLQTLDEERAQEGTRPITRLPITQDELFFYDVILLLDPDPQEIDQAWIELLEKFVGEHAGGLLYMAGPKHTTRLLTGSRTKAFAKLLPVSFGDLGALEVAALLSSNQRAWPLAIVAASAEHPVLRFYQSREETLRRWETLPGIFWSFPVQSARPTAEILAEHSDPTLRSTFGPRPLLVAGRYGAGQTLYLGFNGTWRWRKAGRQAEFFDKFWIQAVRFLVEGRSLEGRRRGYVQTDRDHYEIGQRVTISARLQDAAYNPLVLPKIDAAVSAGDAAENVTLLPVANRPGVYEASLIAKRVGVHTLRITVPGSSTAPGSGGEGGLIESPFTIELPSVETNQVWLNQPLLADLASLSAGKYFEVGQIDQLAAAIPDRTETIEVRSQPRPLWDVGGMLVALVGLLGTEWFLRKWFKLL